VRSASNITSRTTNTVNTNDNTVLHSNSKHSGKLQTTNSTKGSNALIYPPNSVDYSRKLRQTMKSCVRAMDEKHKTAIKMRKVAERSELTNDRGGEWSNLFCCAADVTDESDIVESVSQSDSKSDSSSSCSLDAFLDETTSFVEVPVTNGSNSDITEKTKRYKIPNNPLRIKKQGRGMLAEGEQGPTRPPLSPTKESPEDRIDIMDIVVELQKQEAQKDERKRKEEKKESNNVVKQRTLLKKVQMPKSVRSIFSFPGDNAQKEK